MEFKKYRLGEIATFSQGKQVDVKEQYATKGKDMKKFTRIVDYTNASEPVRYVENYGDRYFASENDLVMIRYGSQTAGMAVMGKNGIIANNLFKINLNNDIVLNKYMYYYLSQKEIFSYLRSSQSSSTMPAISFSIMNSLEIDIPSIDYQKKAINILLKIEKKQELNNKINDNLLKICNSIFHNYLDENNDNIVYKKIIDIADRVVTGKTPSTKDADLWKEEIPFITIPDMHNQVYTIETERKISRLGAKAIIPKDSISVSCIATVGLVSINTEDSQTNQQINSVVMKNEYDLFYLFEYLSEQEDFMKNIAGGSTTYNINKNMFENIEIPYLSIEKMKEFHNIVKNMFNQIKENQLENKNLEKLRDTLLPKLMNGEIDLDKVEI